MVERIRDIIKSLFTKTKKVEYTILKTRAQLIAEGRGKSCRRNYKQ
jgi:hypothetical protein